MFIPLKTTAPKNAEKQVISIGENSPFLEVFLENTVNSEPEATVKIKKIIPKTLSFPFETDVFDTIYTTPEILKIRLKFWSKVLFSFKIILPKITVAIGIMAIITATVKSLLKDMPMVSKK